MGGATVTGRLDDSKHPDAGNQQFAVFTVELDFPDSAQALLRMSKAKTPKDYFMLGFAHDGVFSLVVARSVMIGVESFEGGESLKRFVEPIHHAIQQAVP